MTNLTKTVAAADNARQKRYILGVHEKDRQAYMEHVAGSKVTNDVYTTYSPDVDAAEIASVYGDFLPKF